MENSANKVSVRGQKSMSCFVTTYVFIWATYHVSVASFIVTPGLNIRKVHSCQERHPLLLIACFKHKATSHPHQLPYLVRWWDGLVVKGVSHLTACVWTPARAYKTLDLESLPPHCMNTCRSMHVTNCIYTKIAACIHGCICDIFFCVCIYKCVFICIQYMCVTVKHSWCSTQQKWRYYLHKKKLLTCAPNAISPAPRYIGSSSLLFPVSAPSDTDSGGSSLCCLSSTFSSNTGLAKLQAGNGGGWSLSARRKTSLESESGEGTFELEWVCMVKMFTFSPLRVGKVEQFWA